MRDSWNKTGAFKAWVRKWKIGPGMNDRNRSVRNFVESLSYQEGDFLARYKDSCKQSLELMDEQLYSGFDGTVGEGWVPILDRLAEDLINMGWDRDLHQVKEKFGGLRFYIGNSTEEMEKRIDEAEAECDRTCENCGAPGRSTGGGWIKTLCAECEAKP